MASSSTKRDHTPAAAALAVVFLLLVQTPAAEGASLPSWVASMLKRLRAPSPPQFPAAFEVRGCAAPRRPGGWFWRGARKHAAAQQVHGWLLLSMLRQQVHNELLLYHPHTVLYPRPTPPLFCLQASFTFSMPYVATVQTRGLSYPVQMWYEAGKLRTDVYGGLDSTLTVDVSLVMAVRRELARAYMPRACTACGTAPSLPRPAHAAQRRCPPPVCAILCAAGHHLPNLPAHQQDSVRGAPRRRGPNRSGHGRQSPVCTAAGGSGESCSVMSGRWYGRCSGEAQPHIKVHPGWPETSRPHCRHTHAICSSRPVHAAAAGHL